MTKVYFKNLNGLRFLAALMVFLDHSTMFKGALDPSLNFFSHNFFHQIGGYGVSFFFVLSGFLINYLLLNEIDIKKKLNVKNFYIRRILRIWPLYFLVGIGGTLVGPILLSKLGIPTEAFYGTNLTFLFLFAINIQLIFFEFNRGIVEILWSVCIEEQFYLIWGPLVKFYHKAIVPITIFLIALGFASPFIFEAVTQAYDLKLNLPNYFFTTNAFVYFGFGILTSCIYKYRANSIPSIIFNRIFQFVAIVVLLLFIFRFVPLNGEILKYFKSSIMAILFSYLILASIIPQSIIKFENPLMNYLGKISYGIYVYHTFVLQIMVRIFYKIFPQTNLLIYEFVFPITALLITLLISYLSYEFFEKYFLRMKKKF